MSKADFGRIVASLRKEIRNEFDEPMTQSDLADFARTPLITIQKIEQGRQINLRPELVLNLANALNLSSYSRQAFFLASLGLEVGDLVHTRIAQTAVLDEIRDILAHLQIPGFVTNCFGELILVNPSFLNVINIQLQDLELGHLLPKFNIHRIYFSPEFEPLHTMLGDTYPSFARREVLVFKAMTLKYRNHWYFHRLLPELNRFPNFREHWQSSAFHNEDVFSLSNKLTINHPDRGPLNFVTFPLQALAKETDLFLFNYQPQDGQTARVCAQIAEETGTQPLQLSQGLVLPSPGNW